MDGAKTPVRFAHKSVLAAIVLTAAALYFFPPAEHGFYPRCLLKAWTGLDCPFCGCLRATHQLLHGHVQAAFALNPLFVVVLLPLCALIFASKIAQFVSGRQHFNFLSSPVFIWSFVVLLALFGVLRNLPAFR